MGVASKSEYEDVYESYGYATFVPLVVQCLSLALALEHARWGLVSMVVSSTFLPLLCRTTHTQKLVVHPTSFEHQITSACDMLGFSTGASRSSTTRSYTHGASAIKEIRLTQGPLERPLILGRHLVVCLAPLTWHVRLAPLFVLGSLMRYRSEPEAAANTTGVLVILSIFGAFWSLILQRLTRCNRVIVNSGKGSQEVNLVFARRSDAEEVAAALATMKAGRLGEVYDCCARSRRSFRMCTEAIKLLCKNLETLCTEHVWWLPFLLHARTQRLSPPSLADVSLALDAVIGDRGCPGAPPLAHRLKPPRPREMVRRSAKSSPWSHVN